MKHIANLAGLTDADFKQIYQKMWEIRFFDEEVERLFKAGEIHGTTHLSIGQEATAVGSGYLLEKTDWITSTHRGHGHTIAKGTDMTAMMAELFGKKSGTNGGKGGSMHIAELATGNLGSNGIVGAGYPIAVGAALSMQMQNKDAITICYAGDGSTNEGSFHEALNLASIWHLPVIFFIENNQYGMSSKIDKMINIPEISLRAASYGFPGVTIDGNDLVAVIDATYTAIQRGKSGAGPTLIEALTYRFKGHSKSDQRLYRSKTEEDEWQEQRDPLKLTSKLLIESGAATKIELIEIEQSALKNVQQATATARNSEDVTLADLTTHVYADSKEAHR
ncbi:thiamine pyrophosphate-dependent dehydrogenase E1 component subunit alpha [Carnobacterium gallinarum]|uniref:thiamine pyrophosphate-dependent dehydrogenase E1 component subunit alpha n=1 Tax=Carnobacterium gallinarum TaxID=2749 RepID=UPI0005531576|nr:thiamine pyrophosphate-dependent dehydrogenase E1 component subunit alpha [Carnobacterium gallinarum]